MSIPFLTNIDLNQNGLQNARLQNLPTDPQNPVSGQAWFNTTSKLFSFYNGTQTLHFATEAELEAELENYQAKITATGILKGDGNGGISAATAGADYQAPISVTADRALVSSAGGGVTASSVTAAELSYLSGVTGPIQEQLNSIPKYNYLNGVSCSVADGSEQDAINSAAIAAIGEQYASPEQWDAVVVAVTFTPSDVVKDAMYYYNGTAWTFLYYVSTGIQVANGETAGIVESSDDISFVSGQGTVNQAAKLKTPVNIGLSGVTATAQSFDGSASVTIPVTEVPVSIVSGTLPVEKGGTGAAALTAGQVLIGNGTSAVTTKAIDSAVTESSDNLITSGAVYEVISAAGTVRKYTETNPQLTASGGVATWTVTHSLGSRNVIVDVSMATEPYTQVMVDVAKTNANAVTISIATAQTIAAGTYSITILG